MSHTSHRSSNSKGPIWARRCSACRSRARRACTRHSSHLCLSIVRHRHRSNNSNSRQRRLRVGIKRTSLTSLHSSSSSHRRLKASRAWLAVILVTSTGERRFCNMCSTCENRTGRRKEIMYIAWHVYPQWQDCPERTIGSLSVQRVITVSSTNTGWLRHSDAL